MRLVYLLLITLTVPCFAYSGDGVLPNQCGLFFRTSAVSKRARKVSEKPKVQVQASAADPIQINNIFELFESFRKGYIPPENSQTASELFIHYLSQKFHASAANYLGLVPRIHKALSEHPELTKEPFSDLDFTVSKKVYAISDKAMKRLQKMHTDAKRRFLAYILVDANIGSWIKIFNLEARVVEIQQDPKNKKEIIDIKKDLVYQIIPKTIVEELKSEAFSKEEKLEKLYSVLRSYKEKSTDSNKINQILINLIHYAALSKSNLKPYFEYKDGLEVLEFIIAARAHRDRIAMDLGYKNHFSEVVEEMGVPPKGLERPNELEYLYEGQTAEMKEQGPTKQVQTKGRIIQLNLFESSFRSILGGSCCASDTYPLKALDPNYHYFTQQYEGSNPRGHITVVLGEVASVKPLRTLSESFKKIFFKKETPKEESPLAFIDKIQNVRNTDLPVFIEGVRRSMQEKGYQLVLPRELGNQNGISNESITTEAVRKLFPVESSLGIFELFESKYEFSNRYSRAADGLMVYPVLPNKSAAQFTMVNPLKPLKFKDPVFDDLAAATIKLKDGTSDEKMLFYSLRTLLRNLEYVNDREFNEILTSWILDEKISIDFKIRLITKLFSTRNAGSTNDIIEIAIMKLDRATRAKIYRVVSKKALDFRVSLLFNFDDPMFINKSVHNDFFNHSAASLDQIVRQSQLEEKYKKNILAIIYFIGLEPQTPLFDLVGELFGNRVVLDLSLTEKVTEVLSSEVIPYKSRLEIFEWYITHNFSGSGYEVMLKLFNDQVAVENYLFKDKRLQKRVNRYRDPPREHLCFTENTLVKTSLGDRRIKDIRLGDKVYSYNHTSEMVVFDEVVNLIQSEDSIVLIKTDKGQELRVTESHPFYLMALKKYTPVRDLRVGDQLLQIKDGVHEAVTITTIKNLKTKRKVFNFTTKKHHNYFAEGILVHNIKEIM